MNLSRPVTFEARRQMIRTHLVGFGSSRLVSFASFPDHDSSTIHTYTHSVGLSFLLSTAAACRATHLYVWLVSHYMLLWFLLIAASQRRPKVRGIHTCRPGWRRKKEPPWSKESSIGGQVESWRDGFFSSSLISNGKQRPTLARGGGISNTGCSISSAVQGVPFMPVLILVFPEANTLDTRTQSLPFKTVRWGSEGYFEKVACTYVCV